MYWRIYAVLKDQFGLSLSFLHSNLSLCPISHVGATMSLMRTVDQLQIVVYNTIDVHFQYSLKSIRVKPPINSHAVGETRLYVTKWRGILIVRRTLLVKRRNRGLSRNAVHLVRKTTLDTTNAANHVGYYK